MIIMKNTQKGFIVPALLVIIALLVIGGGVYVYEKNKNTEAPVVVNNAEQNSQNNTPSNISNPAPVTASSASCGDFVALSDYVLKNIQKTDSQNTMQMNPNVITSFRWKRNAKEPFITYPIINGVQAFYGNQETNRTHEFIVSAIKNDSDALGQTINEKTKNLGLSADPLNTLPFQTFSNQDIYLRTFAFRGGGNLYSIVLKVEGGGHQAPPVGVVTVTCGKSVNQYDKVYNALNFKADTTVQDTYDNDYVAIADVSSDKMVYALLGSSNHIKIADYYYFDGTTAKLVSKDSYPAQCTRLESQKVGLGMRCVDVPSYNQRTVNYTSVSTNQSSDYATSYIGSITPWSAPVGTTIEIRGSGLVGFEGDVYFFFKRSDGKIARLSGVVLTQTTGDAVGAQTARVVLKEPCQQGQTVYGDYSGIPAQCDYVQLTPGVYKVYTTPWGKNSNEVQFTVTN